MDQDPSTTTRRRSKKSELVRPDPDFGPDSVDVGVRRRRSGAVRSDSRRLLSHSLFMAAAIPVLLWFSGCEALRSAWSLTLFLVVYLFFSSCCFSTAGTRLTKMFVTLSYGVLLAFTAGGFLGDVLAVVIMVLDSLLAAAFFGSTLAQHRERNGTDKTAAVAAATTVAVATPASKRRDSILPVFALLAVGCAAWAAWLVCPVAGYSVLDAAAALLSALSLLVYLSMMSLLLLLNGGFWGHESSTAVPMVWMGISFMFAMLSHAVFGQLGGFLVQWLSLVLPTVFVGYCLRLHLSSEQQTLLLNTEQQILHTSSLPADDARPI